MTQLIESALPVLIAMIVAAPPMCAFAVWYHNGKKEMREEDEKNDDN